MSQKKTEERKFQKTHGLFQYGKRKSVDFQWFLSTPTDVGHPNMAQCAHADMQSHRYRPDRSKGLTINTDVRDRERFSINAEGIQIPPGGHTC